jgi:hypothetical protein
MHPAAHSCNRPRLLLLFLLLVVMPGNAAVRADAVDGLLVSFHGHVQTLALRCAA